MGLIKELKWFVPTVFVVSALLHFFAPSLIDRLDGWCTGVYYSSPEFGTTYVHYPCSIFSDPYDQYKHKAKE